MKTIHSEEFMELLNDYAEASEGAPMVVVDAAARALISHIDKHCAEVAEQVGNATARTSGMKPEQDNVDVVSAGDGVEERAVAASVQAQPQWLPIEAAPKDRPVWTFNGEQGVMQWSEGSEWALWVWSDTFMSEVDPFPEQPTHYMPLPSPPVKEGE